MKILILITQLCLSQPEMFYICKEKVKACYDLNRELSDLPDREIVRLCHGTYLENQGE